MSNLQTGFQRGKLKNSDVVQRGIVGDDVQRLAALGGFLGALGASACCILPLGLFSMGISGAWIGNLTGLAPYQPYFLVFSVICLGFGYWRVYKARKTICTDEAACTRPLPNKVIILGLVLATALVAAAFGIEFIVPLFLN